MDYSGQGPLKVGFGPAHADCKSCELHLVCRSRFVPGERPADWEPGGLMLIGEGPGKTESSLLRPFVGASGRLLDALCQAAGLDRSKCWVTNATLGLPPPGKGTDAFHERFPRAVHSCLPRLEAEIAEARPRVIVTLGQAALIAVSGYEIESAKLAKFDCTNADCDPNTRKLRTPALVCANAGCDWYAVCVDDPEVIKERFGAKCPKCESSIARLRPKAMKCPTCGGRKTRTERFTTFRHDYGLIGRHGVAGAVFDAEDLSSRLNEFGVKYVIPTYHPAFCLHAAKKDSKYIAGQFAARVVVDHLAKARRLLRSDREFKVTTRITKDAEVVHHYLASKARTYAVDIETNSEDGAWACTKITCIGFASADREETLVVDTRDATPGLLDELQLFLEDPERAKVFHNAQFDRVVIRRLWGMEVLGVVSDTILSHHALYPDEEQGLGFCAHELLDAPHWKEKKRKLKTGELHDESGYESFDALALYNGKDTRSTALIDQVMRGPAGGRGRLDVEKVRASHDMDVRMQEIAIRMELNGVPLSIEKVKRLEAHAETQRAHYLREMRHMLGNPKSRLSGAKGEEWVPSGGDLLWALFSPEGPLRLEPYAYTEGGADGSKKQPSTAKEALARMVDQHPFVPMLIEYRKYDYVLTHYVHGTTLRVQSDGWMHPQWKVYGTSTTRWTSNPNFQNWSKGQAEKDELLNLRALVEAPPGWRIIGADEAQLELRVMGDLTGDAALIRRLLTADESRKLEPDHDPHAYMAAVVFGEAYLSGDTKRKKALRDVVKRVVYGLNYGAGAATVLEAIYNGGYEGPRITLQMIQRITAALFAEYPGIPRWRNEQERKAFETREVRSPLLGSRRIFPLGDVDTTVAYNFPIQSGAANVVNTCLARLDDRLLADHPEVRLFAQVHDAVYGLCPEDRVEKVCKVFDEALTWETSLVGNEQKMLYLATADHAQTWDQA